MNITAVVCSSYPEVAHCQDGIGYSNLGYVSLKLLYKPANVLQNLKFRVLPTLRPEGI